MNAFFGYCSVGIVLLFLIQQHECFSQTKLNGVVLSAEDSAGIAGATVVLRPKGDGPHSERGTLTKPDGSFSFQQLSRGEYEIFVSMIGYEGSKRTFSIVGDLQESIKIFLQPLPVQTEQVIVTASKREQSLAEVPASVSLLTSSAIERRNSLSLDDALRYVPGVNFVLDQVNIRGSSGYARGIGSRALLLIDGIPFLSGDIGGVSWASIPMEDVDHVEVVKGAGSALYGSNALGGIIDVITKNGFGVNSTDVKLYGGVYEQPLYSSWRWSNKPRFFQGGTVSHTFASGELGIKDYGLTTSLSYKKDDGYIENDGYNNLNFYAKMSGPVGANKTLKIFGTFFIQHAENFLYWQDLAHALQPSSSSLGEWANSTRASIAGIYTNVVSPEFFYVIRTSYYFNYWYDNFGKTSTGLGDTSISHLGYLEFQGTLRKDPETILTFGADAEPDFLNSNLFTTKKSISSAVYFQLERKIGRLRAALGARYDYEAIMSRSALNQFNPKLGVVYNLIDDSEHAGEEISLRGSIGTGFRAPSLGELYSNTSTAGTSIVPNPGLLPEKSLSEEIGGRVLMPWYGILDVAIFQSDYWNMIEPEFTSNGVIQFENVTRARIQGYEIDLSSRLNTDFLTLSVSYTYVYPRDLTANAVLKYRSRKIFYVSAVFSHSIFRASIDFRYLSKFENYDRELVQAGIVKDGDQRVPAYVTDLSAGVDLTLIGYPVNLRFILNNIFNYYYVEMIGNIAPVRNYSMVASIKF
jgi:outer membrane receptor for ferrienterochelin and colicins